MFLLLQKLNLFEAAKVLFFSRLAKRFFTSKILVQLIQNKKDTPKYVF
jgi:hypothetical protein